jgi:hypothetical protein
VTVFAARVLRTRRFVAVSVILLVAAAAGAFSLFREQEIRFEVETRSGTAHRIQWNVAGTPDAVGGTVPTPWSTSVTTNRFLGMVTLAALAAESDVVTCRITIGGAVVSESTANHATGCTTLL